MKCQEHATHNHMHSSKCGHQSVMHDGHTDYLHDGHLHHVHGQHVDEHVVEVGGMNPDSCTPEHDCKSHGREHVHGSDCGHQRVPHGDHMDYFVGGHLHHSHDGHCDDHGSMKAAA